MVSVLGINIKKFREKLNWNINELKKQSGVGYATLHDIESGKIQSLTTKTLSKVAKSLNKTPDELLGVEYDVVEHEVADLKELFDSVLLSDELSLDGIELNENEYLELKDLFTYTVETIRRRRSK